ncbi:hypothetical protein PQX77_015925 [Marasmius sp. AFHP31]|nr:hypothetical protein PQX77_015925 [Marasmius sp. AFHP31]
MGPKMLSVRIFPAPQAIQHIELPKKELRGCVSFFNTGGGELKRMIPWDETQHSSNSSKVMVPESHFTSVLHTNYAPSERELEELQDLISEPKPRIERLDEEINRLQAQRNELQQFVDSHSALAAPFRRLSADIWGEIFAHCLPTNKLGVALCTVKEPPLLITNICRAWRDIALSTPRLWSALHVYVPDVTSNPTFSARLEGIKMWLDRSGSRPLTLSISKKNTLSNPHAATDFDSGPCTALMDVLACYSHRWKTLSLDTGVGASHLQPFERLTREDLPLLETVYIGKLALLGQNNPSAAPPALPTENLTPFANLLPQLLSLRSLYSQPASPPVLELASTCHRLTQLTLSVHMPPTVMLRQVATSCRALYTLTIHSILLGSLSRNTAANVLFLREPPIEWPSLQEFNLLLEGSGYYTGGLLDISFHPILKSTFNSIITPQLRRLFIEFAWATSPPAPVDSEIVPFQSFIASSPHLTHLQITGYNIFKAEALSQCLLLAPSLTTLGLQVRYRPPHGQREGLRPRQWLFPPTEWLYNLFLSSLNNLSACPEMEMLDCGRCRLSDIDSILQFAKGEGRLSTLKCLRADLSHLSGGDIYTVTSDAMVHTLDTLKETNGLSCNLEWKLAEPTEPQNDPSKGLPVETSPWAGDNYLDQ